MRSPRFSLATQLFAAVGFTALLVVVIMALLVASSMRQGFSKYLLRGEIEGMRGFATALVETHDPAHPGWPQFRQDPQSWLRFVNDRLPLLPGAPPPRPEPERHRPHPPKRPPLLEERLFLLDAAGNHVAGATRTGAFETLPIRPADGATPVGWLGLTAPGRFANDTDAFFLRGQIRSLLLAAGLAAALSAAAALLLARQLLKPIRALESGAQKLAGGDYAARIPNGRSDELGRLIDHYNRLASSLEAAEIAERQWISDTSHELQTPLAVLRANIEAVQDGVRAPDERTLKAMHDSVDRLTRLVQDLRILSDRREGRLVAASRNVDLAALVRDAVEAATERFAEAGLSVRNEIGSPLPARCDPQRMRQVIDNLLENSLRYTEAPGILNIEGRSDRTGVHLAFEDSAPAPAPESMPHLFDRFHRGEASRSRALGGSGLGLAIARAIVEAHGGEITAEPASLGGLRVAITLPVGEPE